MKSCKCTTSIFTDSALSYIFSRLGGHDVKAARQILCTALLRLCFYVVLDLPYYKKCVYVRLAQVMSDL